MTNGRFLARLFMPIALSMVLNISGLGLGR